VRHGERVGRLRRLASPAQSSFHTYSLIHVWHVRPISWAPTNVRSLIEASLDPLVTIRGEGKITDVNEGSIKVTGVLRGKLIGTDFSDYFTEPDKAREGYLQVFSKGFVTDYPLTIRHRDGRHTAMLYNASIYKDVGGNVLGVFAAARDVTQLVNLGRQTSAHRRELQLLPINAVGGPVDRFSLRPTCKR